MTTIPVLESLQTFNDPDLIKLKNSANEWWDRFLKNDRPCWLLMTGNSHTGKTHVLNALWRSASERRMTDSEMNGHWEWSPSKIWWPAFVNELRAGNAYEKLADTRKWYLLALDEIGATRDTTGFVADQLYVMLGQREKRWTMVTTNLSLDALTSMDERIVNRAFMNDGIVVEVKTIPFHMRKV